MRSSPGRDSNPQPPDCKSGTLWRKNSYTSIKLQSNRHHQQTNTQLFTGRMTPVAQPTVSKHCTPTHSSAIGMSHTCICLPSRSWYSFESAPSNCIISYSVSACRHHPLQRKNHRRRLRRGKRELCPGTHRGTAANITFCPAVPFMALF